MKYTVLVTGASRGIGAEIAKQFALRGHRVVMHGNAHMELAEALCGALTAQHFSAMTVSADITDAMQVSDMLARVKARYGAVDILINNAGVALPQKLLTDCTEEDWARIFDVNVKGAFHMASAVIPDMVAKKSGAIVNISSMWGVTGGSCEVPYSASKAALIGFTKSLAKELAPSGIRVNCIAPGFVMTDMNAALSQDTIAGIIEETPLLRAGRPYDIAAAAMFLSSEEASFITGQVLCVDGGRCI